MLPKEDSVYVQVDVTFRAGTPFDTTVAAVERIEAATETLNAELAQDGGSLLVDGGDGYAVEPHPAENVHGGNDRLMTRAAVGAKYNRKRAIIADRLADRLTQRFRPRIYQFAIVDPVITGGGDHEHETLPFEAQLLAVGDPRPN